MVWFPRAPGLALALAGNTSEAISVLEPAARGLMARIQGFNRNERPSLGPYCGTLP